MGPAQQASVLSRGGPVERDKWVQGDKWVWGAHGGGGWSQTWDFQDGWGKPRAPSPAPKQGPRGEGNPWGRCSAGPATGRPTAVDGGGVTGAQGELPVRPLSLRLQVEDTTRPGWRPAGGGSASISPPPFTLLNLQSGAGGFQPVVQNGCSGSCHRVLVPANQRGREGQACAFQGTKQRPHLVLQFPSRTGARKAGK